MNENLKQLLIFHAYDVKFVELQQLIAKQEKELEQFKQHREKTQHAMGQASETLRKKTEDWDKCDAMIGVLENKRMALRQKSDRVTTIGEIAALQRDMDKLGKQLTSKQEEQLVLLEELEKLTKNLEELKTHHQKLGDDHLFILKLERLGCDLKSVNQTAQGIAKSILRPLMDRYEFQKKSINRPPFLVKLQGCLCMGCHMHLPEETRVNIRKNIFDCCDFCHRMLYCDDEEDEEIMMS
jgi:predicted  nucleic acid-binding Zn-ribbon protein